MTSSEKPQNSTSDLFENVDWLAARTILARLGFEPEAPDAIEETEIRGRLLELIYAMAARRFYLACTDHLSDRELYQWLDENWLNEAAADLPPGAKWNARISPVSGGSEEEGTLVWLRYYADDEERQQFSEDEIPPHEDPANDRDRYLPDAPIPCGACSESDAIENLEELADVDLIAIDAAICLSGDLDDDSMMSFEDEDEWHQPLKVLQRQGVRLLPPDEHIDETIGAGLWELLHELACRGFFVLHTDHLTDRELYAALWKDGLREPAKLPGHGQMTAWYYDFVGSGSEADEQLRLRYYATEKERAKAKRENPGLKLPRREVPMAKRDWRLPKAPF